MASGLDRRIGTLERLMPSGKGKTTVVRFVAVGSVCGPLAALRDGLGGQEWTRLPEESEEAFIERVEMDAPVRPGCKRLLIGR